MFSKKKAQNTAYDEEILEYSTKRRELRDKIIAATQDVIVSKSVVDLFSPKEKQWNAASNKLILTKRRLITLMEDYETVREKYNTLTIENKDERISTKFYQGNRESAQEIVRWAYRDFYRK